MTSELDNALQSILRVFADNISTVPISKMDRIKTILAQYATFVLMDQNLQKEVCDWLDDVNFRASEKCL